MSDLTQNAKILLVVGIVLIVLCAIGMVVQLAAYQEYAGDEPFSFSSSGPANGAKGGFMQSIVAWNQSDQAKAREAMNMFIFSAVGCAFGVLCMYWALRKPKQAAEEEQKEKPPMPSARRRSSTRTTWK